MKKIKLNKGRFALVDDKNFDYLNQWRWHVKFSYNIEYAVRIEYTRMGYYNYKNKQIYMHRVVNNTPVNLQTDHINHNGLDNRRINLRTVTNQQNAFNANLNKANTSGTKGVSWSEERKKWCSYIHIDNKALPLGRFINIEDAIYARKKAELKYHVI